MANEHFVSTIKIKQILERRRQHVSVLAFSKFLSIAKDKDINVPDSCHRYTMREKEDLGDKRLRVADSRIGIMEKLSWGLIFTKI